MAADEKIALLKTIPMFATCEARELERIGMLTEEVDLPAGRGLFSQGDSASELFVVVSGQVRVERNGRLLAMRGPGEFFGEIALVSEGTRTATATCETDVACSSSATATSTA